MNEAGRIEAAKVEAIKATTAAGRWRQRLQQAWQARTVRERRALLLAALLIGTVLVWQGALAPALHTWRQAPTQQAALDAERQQLLQLQQRARQLQALPRIGREEALRWLQGPEVAALGPGAQVQVQGDQVRVQLQAAPAEGLSRWLRAAREQARALPVQIQLQVQAPGQTQGQVQPGQAGADKSPANPRASRSGAGPASGLPPPAAAPAGPRWRGSLVLSLPA